MIKAHIISCPICDKILVPQNINSFLFKRKECKSNHHHFIIEYDDWDDVKSIIVGSKDILHIYIRWNYVKHKIELYNDYNIDLSAYNFAPTGFVVGSLPWFEPDYYTPEKLFKKLKTYVLFS